MNDIAGPSDEHVSFVVQFMEICGAEDEVARYFLRESGWNLENAIQEFYMREETERIGAPRTLSAPPRSAQNAQSVQRRSPTIGISDRLSGWLRQLHYYLVTIPLNFVYASLANFIAFFYMLVASPGLPVTNPRDDVRRFVEIATRHGCGSRFIDGSYEEAVRRAKRNIQCLIIYLHSPSAESERFLAEKLASDEFLALLQRNDCLVWGVESNTGEGRRVANALKIVSFPAVALLTCVQSGTMVSILRLSGYQHVTNHLFEALQTSLDENRPHILPIIREKEAMNQASVLIREQEAEYARSLAADRAKRQEQLQREEEEKARKRAAEEVAQRREAKRQKLLNIRARIRAELPAQPTPVTGGKGGIINVRVRFPSGNNFTWAFDQDASLEELFNVVSADERCPQNFSLIAMYPTAVLACTPEWYREFTTETVYASTDIPTFAQAGLIKSAAVLVRDNDA